MRAPLLGVLIWLASLSCGGTLAAADAPLVWIEVEHRGETTEFHAMAAAAPEGSTYEFVVDVDGGGGVSRTRQAGSVQAGREGVLSRTALRLDGGGTWRLQLTLFDAAGTVLAEARLVGPTR